MNGPRILDLFCGAGGAAMGYHRAGFEVVGVDLVDQPNYPFEFFHMDAFEGLGLFGPNFGAIHASPPCQAYSVLRHAAEHKGKDQPDLIGSTRELLERTGLPYVIENVPGAPTRHQIVLCGSMFGLGSNGRQLRRHRNFETSFPMMSPPCYHEGEAIGVYGGGPTGRYTFGNGAKKDYYGRRGGYQGTVAEKQEAMNIDWMTASELNQAIPPAYCQFIGEQLMQHLAYERKRDGSSPSRRSDTSVSPDRKIDSRPRTGDLAGNASSEHSVRSAFAASAECFPPTSKDQDARG